MLMLLLLRLTLLLLKLMLLPFLVQSPSIHLRQLRAGLQLQLIELLLDVRRSFEADLLWHVLLVPIYHLGEGLGMSRN